MATQVQHRRGTRAENDVFTGAEAEFIYLTDEDRIVAHDGALQGGRDIQLFSDQFNNTYNYAAASGTDTLTVDLFKAPTAYQTGQGIAFKAANTNTGAVTLNLNSLGAKDVQKVVGTSLSALEAEDIVQNSMYRVLYNGTVWVLQNPSTVKSGSWETISTLSLASSPNITFDSGIDSTYKLYRIRGLSIDPSADISDIIVRTDSSGGASYDNGVSDYDWSVRRYNVGLGTSADEFDIADSEMELIGTAGNPVGSAASEGFSFEFMMLNPANASQDSRFRWNVEYGDSSGRYVGLLGWGSRRSGAIVNAIQFTPNTGNFTSGDVSLEGWSVL
jgi:hypothetical protein